MCDATYNDFEQSLQFQKNGSIFETGFQRKCSFGTGFPIGVRTPCWLGESNGDSVPVAVDSKGGRAALVRVP